MFRRASPNTTAVGAGRFVGLDLDWLSFAKIYPPRGHFKRNLIFQVPPTGAMFVGGRVVCYCETERFGNARVAAEAFNFAARSRRGASP